MVLVKKYSILRRKYYNEIIFLNTKGGRMTAFFFVLLYFEMRYALEIPHYCVGGLK